MVRNLPEGSRYHAVVAVDHKPDSDQEADPHLEALLDHRVWTIDRKLMAATVNAINMNTAATGMWSEKPPDFPIVGPASWKEEEPKEEEEYTDNFDFFRKKGFPIG